VLARAGRIDALVNNAGIGGGGAIEDVPVDWAKSLFETNYFGRYSRACASAAPASSST
jgi:NAD(P)-dependent dehydrogenase (short-subunit alcohol dehydrogenase family)